MVAFKRSSSADHCEHYFVETISMGLNGSALLSWLHIGYFGIVLPIGALRARSKYRLRGAVAIDRVRHYHATVVSLATFGLFSILVAYKNEIVLFPRSMPSFTALSAGVAMYLLTIGIVKPRWRKAVEGKSSVVLSWMPRTPRERIWWFLVSVFAGVGEEITWRYVLVALLTPIVGNYWIAAAGSAISFVVAHAVQGFRSMGPYSQADS
jgi:hypothetical protein